MPKRKKGISSILGAIILIQIMIISIGLILYINSLTTKIYNTEYMELINNLRNSPISVIPTTLGPKIVSSSGSSLVIKYIIYPNGEVLSTNIPLTPSGTYINFNGFPWAIIVLNDGVWYNISYYDRIYVPNDNLNGLTGIKVYSPYSYSIYSNPPWSKQRYSYVETYYVITPPEFGNNMDPSSWNLMSYNPSSFTEYGITNAVILVSENNNNIVNIPINVNYTYYTILSSIFPNNYPYFDIIIPYNGSVLVTQHIYSNYLPLEFNIIEKNFTVIPLYNATFKIGVWNAGYQQYLIYYVTLSYVTYNMIYFMQRHNNEITLYKNDTIQLVNYKFLGYTVISSISYGSVEMGMLVPGKVIIPVAIPGYNNYTTILGQIDAHYSIINITAIPNYFSLPYIISTQTNSTEYANIINASKHIFTSVNMMISGGNLDYNASGSPISNILNYSYLWFFNTTTPQFLNIIISITSNSQISVFLKSQNGNIIYPAYAYIYYNLASYYHCYIVWPGSSSYTVVQSKYINGILINGTNLDYLPLLYPIVKVYYNYGPYSFTEYAWYEGYKTINIQINYEAPFMILVPNYVYYPYYSNISL